MTTEKLKNLNKVANKFGFEICGAAWANDCYDIYTMSDENEIPEYADYTESQVIEFVNTLLIPFEELAIEGDYIAITEDGEQYEASAVKNDIKPYCNKFGIIVYFCIPDYKKIIGYIK